MQCVKVKAVLMKTKNEISIFFTVMQEKYKRYISQHFKEAEKGDMMLWKTSQRKR